MTLLSPARLVMVAVCAALCASSAARANQLPAVVAIAPTSPAAGAAPGENPAVTARAREWFHRLQTGEIDRSQLTPEMRRGLTADTVATVQARLKAMGTLRGFTYAGFEVRGDNTAYYYHLTFPSTELRFVFVLEKGGKVSGLWLRP